jgi:tight adherence protein B
MAAALVCGTLVAGLTRIPMLALIASSVAAWAPFGVRRARAFRRAVAVRDQWPDVIEELISMVRSGTALPEAWVRLSAREFPGIAETVSASVAVYEATGSFSHAMREARRSFADPVADHVLLSLEVAHEVGGTDLVPVLRTLAASVNAEMSVRKEVTARWSWTVSSARIAAAAPWVVLLLMLSRAETVRAYSTPAGATVLAGAALASLAGYRLMLWAARLPTKRAVVS